VVNAIRVAIVTREESVLLTEPMTAAIVGKGVILTKSIGSDMTAPATTWGSAGGCSSWYEDDEHRSEFYLPINGDERAASAMSIKQAGPWGNRGQ
jgi:hypothetical protein